MLYRVGIYPSLENAIKIRAGIMKRPSPYMTDKTEPTHSGRMVGNPYLTGLWRVARHPLRNRPEAAWSNFPEADLWTAWLFLG